MGFDGALVAIAAPAMSIASIAITTAVLVLDLERPERFYYILTKSNWRSWMVWGAWFLIGHGLAATAWLAAGWFGWDTVLDLLAWPAIVIATLATSYTGFLFAQGLARDLWQGPHAAIDLIAQSGAAGAAVLLLASLALGDAAADARPVLGWILSASLVGHVTLLLFENVLSPSPTRHHELAVDTIRRGHYARLFWGVAIAAGGLVPLALALGAGATGPALVVILASLLALAGSAAWEYIWVEAGQSVPLS
jgi:formate-dependent nitrite reductase membrane component NrfD